MALGKQTRRKALTHAFTLLEVMVATIIVAMLVFTLYRFINTTLSALRFSTDLHSERAQFAGVIEYLQTQINDLPPKRQGAITGAAFKFHDLASDELTWLCKSGHGVLTDAAPGDYRVTLALQPVDKSSTELELGLRREPVASENDAKLDADFFTRGSGAKKYNWVPLIKPVAAIKIRYFDARLNQPIERWTDLNARPTLVQVWIWKRAEDEPYEAILTVPSSRLQTTQ